MTKYVFNPSTPQTTAGGSLCVWGQQGLYSKFQNNQSYSETLSKNNFLSRTETTDASENVRKEELRPL